MKCLISKAKWVLMYSLLVLNSTIYAQEREWQNWNSVSLRIPVSKKVDFNLAEMLAFTPSDAYSLNFAQSTAAISVDITRRFAVKFGDQLNYIPGSAKPLRNRFFVQGSIANRFSKLLKSEHSLQAEFHSKAETRYQQRLIFTNNLSLRSRFSPLRLRPSVSYSLYYNIGGSALQYFDKTGNPTVMQSPDGFHRGRLSVRLNSRINGHVQLSVYYLNQSEFNLLGAEDKNMNVVDPSTGEVARPFDDYNAVGVSLLFSIKKTN